MTTLTILAFFLVAANEPTTMPKVVFWILLILWAVGGFWTPSPDPAKVGWARGDRAVQIILFAILGFYLMGF